MGAISPDFQHAAYHHVGDGAPAFDSYPTQQEQEIDLTPQDPTAVSPFSTIPRGHYGQWWSPDDAAFAATADMTAPNIYAAEPQFNNYAFHPDIPTRWPSSATSSHSYPLPSPSTDATSLEISTGSPESRRDSLATQPEKRKRTRKTSQSITEKPTTSSKSAKRGSTRKTSKSATTEKPKTRGSKTKKTTSPEPDDEVDEVDEYSKKVQERNRIASNKFRVKKREDAKKLRADEKDMERANRDLTSCVSDLTMQVYELKMRLLQHKDCNCHLIQDYIANEAHRYIQDLGDGKQTHATPPLPPGPHKKNH
ncbi:hypothetical protein F53441_14123 [Fusarium austroafricanum]|uniref:BZIP domain-containing protein n=1 Tax=Fusarium austroafricanum TaxID=2364996 RepID=A0A8H4NCA6_9HYPO|nr:hypothetical protein F53441_14123 [Fusarium austroafricanum]